MKLLSKSAARVWTLPVAVAVSMAMMLGLASPASATAATGNGNGRTVVTGAEARAAVDAVMARVAAGEIAVHAPESALNTAKATVLAIDSDQGVFTSVTLPVGGGYSLVSNFTVVLAPGGKVAQYAETLFSKNAAGNFQITQYADGKLTRSEDIGLAYRTDAELLAQPTKQAPQGPVINGIGAAAACLAGVLGVGGWFAYLIISACAGACVTSATGFSAVVCAACIGAYAAIGGAGMGAIVGCFNLL